MMKNVLLIDFENEKNAYEGFKKITEINISESKVLEAALVNEESNQLEIKESIGIDDNDTNGTLLGGFIGAILGLFTGGFGWILWGSVGILLGAVYDNYEDEKEQTLLTDMSKRIHRNHLSIIAVVEESNCKIINHYLEDLSVAITRYNFEDIEEEIKETEQLNKRIAKAAKKELLEQRKKVCYEKIEQAKNSVFHHKK